MSDDAISLPFDQPPQDAVAYFRSKDMMPSFRWTDVWREEHAHAFMVAGVTQIDVLEDIHGLLDKAISEGTDFEDFKRDFQNALAAKGWWGKKQITAPKTGEVRTIDLSAPWRMRTIWHTNIQSAYNAGHYRQMVLAAEASDRRFFRYTAVMDSRTRPEHRAWDGVILPYNDPWWTTHWPPNGWGCRCTVESMSRRDMRKEGIDKPSRRPKGDPWWWDHPTKPGVGGLVPWGVDAGFDYNPGMDWTKQAGVYLRDRMDNLLVHGREDTARAALDALMASTAFDLWMRDPSWIMPMAIIPDAEALAVGGKSYMRTAYMTDRLAEKNKGHHPDLATDDYARIPDIVAKAEHAIQEDKDPSTILYLSKEMRLMVVVKTHKDGPIVTSFHGWNPNKRLEYYKKRGKDLREKD